MLLIAGTACRADESFRDQIKQLPAGKSLKDVESGVVFTFNQKNAGVKGVDGWYAATSLPCGFSARLPGPYNDFSQTSTTTDGQTIHLHTVGTRTTEGVKFTALCIERSDQKFPPHWVDQLVASFRKDGTAVSEHAALLAGQPATEFAVGDSSVELIVRCAVIDQRAYQLMVEYPQSEAGYMPDVAASFFDSFRPNSTGPR